MGQLSVAAERKLQDDVVQWSLFMSHEVLQGWRRHREGFDGRVQGDVERTFP